MRIVLLLLFLLCICGGNLSLAAPTRAELQERISTVVLQIESERLEEKYWDYPSQLGSHFFIKYLFALKWLNKSWPCYFEEENFTRKLLASQMEGGSWQMVKEANIQQGDINATFWSWWYLKSFANRTPEVETSIQKAEKFVRDQGGIESLNLITKILLASFGRYDWNKIIEVPDLVMGDFPLANLKMFAAWVEPHIRPIHVLRKFQVTRVIPELADTSSLYVGSLPGYKADFKVKIALALSHGSKDIRKWADRLRVKQLPEGTWGGYALSTILTLMVLDQAGMSEAPEFLKGVTVLEQRNFRAGKSSQLGANQDGRYWDTILMLQGLVESGKPANDQDLIATVHYLLNIQVENGGIPFGKDFETMPDVDDTSEWIIAMLGVRKLYSDNHALTSKIDNGVLRAYEFIKSMQNNDGGWGAFSRNNFRQGFVGSSLGPFLDTVDLFDESSADVTGHVLEAIGKMGVFKENGRTQSTHVRKALKYLTKNQNSKGAWLARWGVNYIYGTSAVLNGLSAIGYPANSQMVKKAKRWLMEKQNTDGGWGESSLSDLALSWMGVGNSTVSQTAWAMTGLMAFPDSEIEKSIGQGAQYILNFHDFHGSLFDTSTVGNGQPKILYMDYPSYPWAFSVMALSRYRDLRNSGAPSPQE